MTNMGFDEDPNQDGLRMTLHYGDFDASYDLTSSTLMGGSQWTAPSYTEYIPKPELEITHVVEEEEGLVGYTEDGSRVLLGDWVPTAVSLRVRSLLERIAAGEGLRDEDLEKFAYLKRLLGLQQEELDLTAKRIEFIERLIAGSL